MIETDTAPATDGARALDLAVFFAPRSIAVIGASADEGRHNGRPMANLERTGYSGRVYPVTPREGDIRGHASHRRIGDVPERVDLAYILVRADLVEQVVQECADAGVRGVVVCSSGFAEEGADGEAAQRRIRELAARTGMRVIGPNCIGLISVPENVLSCTTLNVTTRQLPGDVAIVSQSGGMAANLFNRAQGDGVGVRAMVSLGNEADVDVADVLDALARDEATRTILLYVEQLRDIDRFRAAARAARDAGKAVLVLKVGRSAAGVRSAQSHTGAMAGSYEVFRDLMRPLGVQVVETIDDLVDAARVRQELGRLDGRRTLVVSPSGGECGYVADRAEEAGLDLVDLSSDLRAGLAQVMRFGSPGNPLDLTGQIIGDRDLLGNVFAAIAESAEYDCIVVALPTWGEFDSARLTPAIVEATAASRVPMMITAWESRGLTEWRDEHLRTSGVPVFADAGRAVRALALVAALAESPAADDAPIVSERAILPAAAVRDEAGAKAWLASHGLPVSDEREVRDHDAARAAAADVGFPLVLKGLCAGVQHKSDLGLVVVDIPDPAALDTALADVDRAVARHGLALEGYLVARRYRGVEMIAGAIADPVFGSVLMIGAGGVLAEALEDRTFLPCPASPAQVREAVARLRVGRVLAGHRGRSGDIAAFADVVAAASRIVAAHPEISEMDLNPIIVGSPGEGCVLVDALVARAD